MTAPDPTPAGDGAPAPAGAPPGAILALVRAALAALDGEQPDDAILACEQALRLDPACAEAFFILGLVTFELEEPLQAIKLLEKAHELDPEVREYADALAAVGARLGKVTDSLFYAKLATTLEPHPTVAGLLPERLGTFFENLERGRPDLYRERAERKYAAGAFDQAIGLCETQLDLTPGDGDSLRLLARACLARGRIERAAAACHAVLHAGPPRPADLSLLAGTLAAAGRHDEAAACLDRAVELAPDDPCLASRRLAALVRREDVPAGELAAAHRDWQRRHAAQLEAGPMPDEIEADPERALRIGYLCGDLRAPDLVQLLDPLLRAGTSKRLEAFCYAEPDGTDPAIEGLMRAAHRWTDLRGVDDETAWEILRGDRIDIVVDLCGHDAGGRPLLLARKPAPLAVSWLGYPHPPGLAAVDFFLSDARAWPEDAPEPETGERVWRLPRGHLAFRPPALVPEVGDSPAARGGAVTFGLRADLGQIGPRSAALWSGVLHGCPGSRLLICNALDLDLSCVERCTTLFSHFGLRDRVDVVNMADNFRTEFEFYGHIDIALDTLPRPAPAEACRALWMGVPLLALCGDRHATRLGAGVLAAAGHPEWIAETPAALVDLARDLAGDPERLSATRNGLRAQVSESPLADVAGFADDLHQAFREMWRGWCRGRGA